MYNVFLEEKRQRERAASIPEALSGAALKRRQTLAQRYPSPKTLPCALSRPMLITCCRYHTRVEFFMRQRQLAGVVDAVNDAADVCILALSSAKFRFH
jgi:hypothetical protein